MLRHRSHCVVAMLQAAFYEEGTAQEQREGQDFIYKVLFSFVSTAEGQPWLTAALAESGLLADLVVLGKRRVRLLRRLLGAGCSNALFCMCLSDRALCCSLSPAQMVGHQYMMQDTWASSTVAVLVALKRHARHVLDGLSGCEEAAEAAGNLQAALDAVLAATSRLASVERAMAEIMPPGAALPGPGLAPRAEAQMQQLRSLIVSSLAAPLLDDAILRCVAELGAALRRCQQLPDQREAAQLELALAAAARSCANLACQNLETVRARELAGKGNQRCSACKVSRYCCPTCHAQDWRQGGHRRACPLLKAAMAAQAQPQD